MKRGALKRAQQRWGQVEGVCSRQHPSPHPKIINLRRQFFFPDRLRLVCATVPCAPAGRMDLSDSCVSCTFPECAHSRKRKPRTVHALRAEQGHSRYTFSAHNPVSATIDSGDIVEVQCWDSSEHDCGLGEGADAAKLEHLFDRRRPKPLGAWGNPLCDPVVVKGAMPGETLKVEILEKR